jgi:hypothetical protein
MASADLYISIDVEADGPIPGPYSMLSLGMAVAGRFDGERFEPLDPERETFYRELRPISQNFDPEALAVSGLDREELVRSGCDPRQAMTEADRWVRTAARKRGRAVAVGWPLTYDWTWVYWYFMRFAGRSPFGFSSALDLKTLYARAASVPVTRATKSQMPAELLTARRHTHHALDDALEQAELLHRLMSWATSGERSVSADATSR